MTAVALNNLLNYINEMNLSDRNRKWLGERILEPVKKARKAHVYDPETGEYLNDETVKAIEEARQGKGVVSYGSYEDFLKDMRAL